MDNELIERARELAGAATPGPWSFYDAYDIIDRPGVVGARRLGTKEDTIIEASRYGYDELNVSETDAAFIAASRELVPALADALEAAQAENARLREALVRFAKIDLTGPIGNEIAWDILNARAALEPRP